MYVLFKWIHRTYCNVLFTSQSVQWSKTLELEGAEEVGLSPESSTLDFSLTNREGNASIQVKDAEEPFEICLSISPSSSESDQKLKHVIPDFEGKDDFLVYHQLTLDKEGGAVKVDLKPTEDAHLYVVLYGVGYKPALRAYDGREFLKDLENTNGKELSVFAHNII